MVYFFLRWDGLVIEFAYLKGKTFKEREFSKSSAPVKSSASKDIGVLCNFYKFNQVGILSSIAGDKHQFINIDNYIGTVKEPSFSKKILAISPKLVLELKKLKDGGIWWLISYIIINSNV